MCTVCGCGRVDTALPGDSTPSTGGGVHADRGRSTGAAELDFGANAARVSVPGMSTERAIRLEADVLGANDRIARANRARFRTRRVAAYNLVSSPGAGKTTLLVATLNALRRVMPQLRLAVIEGDQQTRHDADRILATGVAAVQVNTGKGCHLDAPMVAAASARLPLDDDAHAGTLLFVENVGNLVCPALWDLGERAKVAVLSVTEGDDKPAKYPDLFAASRLMVVSKTDLLPHVDFDLARCIDFARRVNPRIEVLLVSAKTGVGLEAWVDWLLDDLRESIAEPAGVAAAQGAAG